MKSSSVMLDYFIFMLSASGKVVGEEIMLNTVINWKRISQIPDDEGMTLVQFHSSVPFKSGFRHPELSGESVLAPVKPGSGCRSFKIPPRLHHARYKKLHRWVAPDEPASKRLAQ